MPVDKFRRNFDTVYTGINKANLTNIFVRRDGSNTAIRAIDMNSHLIKNVADPFSNHVVATNNYVDKTLLLLLAVLSGDIKLNVGSDLLRYLGCNDLTTGKKFTLLLESDTNVLSYSLPDSQLKVYIKIKLIEVLSS